MYIFNRKNDGHNFKMCQELFKFFGQVLYLFDPRTFPIYHVTPNLQDIELRNLNEGIF